MERNECAEILTKLANTKITSIMRYPIKIQDVLKNDILFKTLTSKKEFIKDSFCRFERKYCAGDIKYEVSSLTHGAQRMCRNTNKISIY